MEICPQTIIIIEPWHDKTNKMRVRPAKTQISLGIPRFLHADSKRLIRLGGCPGWSESSLDIQSLCWFCHIVAHMLHCLWDRLMYHCCLIPHVLLKRLVWHRMTDSGSCPDTYKLDTIDCLTTFYIICENTFHAWRLWSSRLWIFTPLEY